MPANDQSFHGQLFQACYINSFLHENHRAGTWMRDEWRGVGEAGGAELLSPVVWVLLYQENYPSSQGFCALIS